MIEIIVEAVEILTTVVVGGWLIITVKGQKRSIDIQRATIEAQDKTITGMKVQVDAMAAHVQSTLAIFDPAKFKLATEIDAKALAAEMVEEHIAEVVAKVEGQHKLAQALKDAEAQSNLQKAIGLAEQAIETIDTMQKKTYWSAALVVVFLCQHIRSEDQLREFVEKIEELDAGDHLDDGILGMAASYIKDHHLPNVQKQERARLEMMGFVGTPVDATQEKTKTGMGIIEEGEVSGMPERHKDAE